MEIIWQDFHHRELSVAQLYQVLALRNAVFIVEQNCPYQDVDGVDLMGENRHLLGLCDGQLMACARLLAPENISDPVKIGRVIVSGKARGLKLGNRLMEQAILSCKRHWPQQDIKLSAQAHLQAFYGQFGFIAKGKIYLEDEIPHVDMVRQA